MYTQLYDNFINKQSLITIGSICAFRSIRAYLAYRYRLLDFGGPWPYLNILYRRRKSIDVLAFRLCVSRREHEYIADGDMEQWSFSLFLNLDSVLMFSKDAGARYPWIYREDYRILKSESERLKCQSMRKHADFDNCIIWYRCLFQSNFIRIAKRYTLSVIIKMVNCSKSWTYDCRSDSQQVDVSPENVYWALQKCFIVQVRCQSSFWQHFINDS